METSYKGFKITITNDKEFTELMKKHESEFYKEITQLSTQKVFSNKETEKLNSLNECYNDNITLNIKITNQSNDFIGWCYGNQLSRGTFTMHSSYIDPMYRCQGIYSSTLNFVINWASYKGFCKIVSNHLTTNNSIIIPKLKRGFTIQGIHLDERFGMTVQLAYHLNENLKTINQIRVNGRFQNKSIIDFMD